MEINYNFVPEYKSSEIKFKSDVISYAGKLLEILGSRTLIVGVDNDNVPFVLQCDGRLVNALDLEMETYWFMAP